MLFAEDRGAQRDTAVRVRTLISRSEGHRWNADASMPVPLYLIGGSPQPVTSKLVSMRRLEPVTWRSLQKKASG